MDALPSLLTQLTTAVTNAQGQTEIKKMAKRLGMVIGELDTAHRWKASR